MLMVFFELISAVAYTLGIKSFQVRLKWKSGLARRQILLNVNSLGFNEQPRTTEVANATLPLILRS